jgi:RNA 2',3'-cyclic 3'-phosphodiesterase
MAPVAPSATRRLFIAVMLPTAVQERLAGLIGLLDMHRAILRPTRPEGLHFTLRFLGTVTAAQEQQLVEAVAAAVDGVSAFPLVIGGFGAFPNMRRPRVIWLGLREGAAPLVALQSRVEDELRRRALVSDSEEFTPHLTLARVRPEASPATRAALGAALAALPTREQARSTAHAVSLVHSVLTPQGSRYTVLNDWPLP